ncbi:MAG: hypothetical protein QGG40_15670, partial [Myxococcota bacterium]|nr:hypothetical protein [Myxococcota bacterium]
MVRALGYSVDTFNPAEPGRLCRGRERWIVSFPLEEIPVLHRLVVSGSMFTNDSAQDAQRGLPYSGLTVGQVITALFPGLHIITWAEDAHPRLVPPGAAGVEHYELRRPGDSLRNWASRWSLVCTEPDQIDVAIAAGGDTILLLDDAKLAAMTSGAAIGTSPSMLAPLADSDPAQDLPGLPDELREMLFLLTGSRQEGAPGRFFQAAAIPDALTHVEALILVHRDKHGPCLGIYTEQPLDPQDRLQTLADDHKTLAVPFAIP